MNIQKAIGFVMENGDALERAKLARLLGKDCDIGSVITGFGGLQNPDGGFPFMDRQGFPSCLSNTSMALKNLLDLELGDSEPARRAIDFFLGRMDWDGSWGENPRIAPLNPPFWDAPDDPKTTVWLTADICDNLLRSRRVDAGGLALTGDFLEENQAPDGRLWGYIHGTWLAVAVFGNGGLNRPQPWKDALDHLATVDMTAWDASSLAWCLDCLARGGVRQDSEVWARAFGRLDGLQCADGSWESADGERFRVSTTVAVLAIGKSMGMV